jgi:hypothetical protein
VVRYVAVGSSSFQWKVRTRVPSGRVALVVGSWAPLDTTANGRDTVARRRDHQLVRRDSAEVGRRPIDADGGDREAEQVEVERAKPLRARRDQCGRRADRRGLAEVVEVDAVVLDVVAAIAVVGVVRVAYPVAVDVGERGRRHAGRSRVISAEASGQHEAAHGCCDDCARARAGHPNPRTPKPAPIIASIATSICRAIDRYPRLE